MARFPNVVFCILLTIELRTGVAFKTLLQKYHSVSPRKTINVLQAKKAKRKGRSGRRSRPNGDTNEDKTKSNNRSEHTMNQPLAQTTRTKQTILSLNQTPSQPPLRVCIVEIDDEEWWENSSNDPNPFGAKLWPSSLGVAQYLSSLGEKLRGMDVLELGCGTGLVSLTAAKCGATVVASDVSSMVLSLTQNGWRKTRETRKTTESHKDGALSTITFDICSSLPLPLPPSKGEKEPSMIVIAAAMLYEAGLAEALARRAAEACALGAWVIIGDDDTGEREGGRRKFESALDRIEAKSSKTTNSSLRRIWTNTLVKNDALGWRGKQVKLLHINPPKGFFVEDDET